MTDTLTMPKKDFINGNGDTFIVIPNFYSIKNWN